MLLLALDTSTSAITVALHDGRQVTARVSTVDPRAHAEHLAVNIRRVLTETGASAADVTHVVAGRGPGPFTGLRVGLVTAVTFGFALDIPVSGVCSLDAMAYQAFTEHAGDCVNGLMVATDARRREVYWARYTAADTASGVGPGITPGAGAATALVVEPVRVEGPGVGPAGELTRRSAEDQTNGSSRATPQSLDGLPVVGRGAVLYPTAFGSHLGIQDVDAGALAQLAVARLHSGRLSEPATPLYLRRPDARTPAERKRALS